MEIEVRLRELLERINKANHGVRQKIVLGTGSKVLNRQTVAKLMRGKMPKLSEAQWSALCEWLRRQGVKDELPGALFRERPADLWSTLASVDDIRFYLAEYQLEDVHAGHRWKWISGEDAEAMSRMVEGFSRVSSRGGDTTSHGPKFEYVPCHIGKGSAQPDNKRFLEDTRRAAGLFSEMRNVAAPCTSVLIGSQRGNFMVECLIADLFETPPFPGRGAQTEGPPKVPFYLRVSEQDRIVQSCFGGLHPPSGLHGPEHVGVHYRDTEGKWRLLAWSADRQDIGIVVVVRTPGGVHRYELALFGFRAGGTRAMATELLEHPSSYWPETIRAKNDESWLALGRREAQVFLCHFDFSPKRAPGAAVVERLRLAPQKRRSERNPLVDQLGFEPV